MDQIGKLRLVDARLAREGLLHQRRKVDRAEQAGAVWRQRLLAARVGRADCLCVVEIVARIDAVDEDDAGFGPGEGRGDDLVPERARLQRLVDRAIEDEVPGRHPPSPPS